MVEGPSKRDPTVVSGRTRQNKLVHFAPAGPAPAAGAYARVLITGAAPHHLRGELVEVTAGPSTPRRIPVSVR